MKSIIQLKTITPPLVIITVALLCLGAAPKAFGVSPPPDGGYPGGNTAEGQAALLSLTTGGYNTAVGFLSLRSNTAGAFNTSVGAGTLLANTADSNTATGAGALLSNTTGNQNTANGAFALFSNTTGTANTAYGFNTLFSNTTGYQNTATGDQALYGNTTGFYNTANGINSLFSNSTGTENTAIGWQALHSSATGSLNTAIGSAALNSNTTGSLNIAVGAHAGAGITTANNVICIGTGVLGANVSASCFVGNIRGVTPQGEQPIPVVIDAYGQLGTMSSSRRYKTDIKPIDKTSESILALKPVSFRYKVHKNSTPQFGLIAEEVAKVNSDLVIYDADSKPYTVRYEAVNAMLLNEFLKEHRTVQEQGATITKLKKEIENLTSTVKEQAAQIQKVSAQIEISQKAAQVVGNQR